jgi:hypothetical protein
MSDLGKNDQNQVRFCRFFIQGRCNHGDSCKFTHDKNICRKFFLGETCKHGTECKFKHIIGPTINKRDDRNNKTNDYKKKTRHPKNTENFNPSHSPADMIVHAGIPAEYTVNDVIIFPNFINEPDIYDKLLKEMSDTGISESELWKLWHGDNHLIADDHLNYKEKVPTFGRIVDEITKKFKIDVKSTRFNLYKNSDDWKPFHHDAAAVKEHIAKAQNFTVGVSFGATREIAFENAKTKTTVSFSLPNGSAYAFSKDINVNWKHGVPQISPEKKNTDGRISIIAWGFVDMI